MRALAITAMVVTGLLSAWSCSSASRLRTVGAVRRPDPGWFCRVALVGLVFTRERLVMIGTVAHASGCVLALSSYAAPTSARSIAGLVAVLASLVAGDLFAAAASVRAGRR